MMRRAAVVVLVAASTVLGSAAPAGAAEHVVQPGEWLWSIARAELRSLGATEPTRQQVGAPASELYAMDRDVIGPDPDLLLPGMRLVAARCTCDGAGTAVRGGFELLSDPVVRRYPS